MIIQVSVIVHYPINMRVQLIDGKYSGVLFTQPQSEINNTLYALIAQLQIYNYNYKFT